MTTVKIPIVVNIFDRYKNKKSKWTEIFQIMTLQKLTLGVNNSSNVASVATSIKSKNLRNFFPDIKHYLCKENYDRSIITLKIYSLHVPKLLPTSPNYFQGLSTLEFKNP